MDINKCTRDSNSHSHSNFYWTIGHVRYINILTWLRGFQVKLLYLVLFYLYPSLLGIEGQKKHENLQF